MAGFSLLSAVLFPFPPSTEILGPVFPPSLPSCTVAKCVPCFALLFLLVRVARLMSPRIVAFFVLPQVVPWMIHPADSPLFPISLVSLSLVVSLLALFFPTPFWMVSTPPRAPSRSLLLEVHLFPIIRTECNVFASPLFFLTDKKSPPPLSFVRLISMPASSFSFAAALQYARPFPLKAQTPLSYPRFFLTRSQYCPLCFFFTSSDSIRPWTRFLVDDPTLSNHCKFLRGPVPPPLFPQSRGYIPVRSDISSSFL